MNIDWSKAPEGATHKETSSPDGFWYRFDFERNTAEFCPIHSTRWSSTAPASAYSDGSMDHMVARPPESTVSKPVEAKDLEQMVETVSAITGSSVYINDIRWVCAALIDAGYRKFEIVEEDV